MVAALDRTRLTKVTPDEMSEGDFKRVNKFNDIPAPTDLVSGKLFYVVNDPERNNNGFWMAGGSDIGMPATTITKN